VDEADICATEQDDHQKIVIRLDVDLTRWQISDLIRLDKRSLAWEAL
jgi:hypothetical protein